MRGTLTEQPLAELIREISIKGFSGTLRLEQQSAKTVVYFENGQIIYAASNLRSLRLQEYLTKLRLISASERATLRKNQSDLALAAALSEQGRLKQSDVDALHAVLVNDVLRVALLWTVGTWDFSERARLDDPVRVQVDNVNLLREAAQRLPLKFVSERFRHPSEMISRAAGFAMTTNFQPTEGFMLSRLDQPTRLEDLVSLSGLRELDALRIIYGLALGGFVEREHWHSAFRTTTTKPRKDQTPTQATQQASDTETAPTDGRWSSVTVADEDLEKFLQRLRDATDYYDIMEMPLNASTNEIKNAYYDLARRFHPDRYHLKSGTRVHAELGSAFARITQAYEALTNPNARAAYDQTIDRSKRRPTGAKSGKTDPIDQPVGDAIVDIDPSELELGSAEYNFREGLAALQQGRVNEAMTHLATASRLEPQVARYRANYGRALAEDPHTRRLAENEIQAAVKLEPANASFRVMLAELFFDLKFQRRAQTELDRALTLDPNNAAAHSLLRKMGKSRKVG